MKKRLMMVMCCGIMILGNLSGCNAMKTKETEYHWPTSTLVKSLPVPESKYGEIVLDAEDSFEIDVFNTSKSQFADYINACKENGFNVDYYGTEDSYDAENKDGYTLSLSYDKRKKTMNIDIYDLDDDTEDTQEPEETEEPEEKDDSENAKDTSKDSSKTDKKEKKKTSSKKKDGAVDADFKKMMDSYEDFFDEYIEFMKKYDIEKYIQKGRELYGKKCHFMLDCIEKYFPKCIKYTRPQGGLFILCTAPEGTDTNKLLAESLKYKVAFVPGNSFSTNIEAPSNLFRLNYSTMPEEKIEKGIAALGKVLHEMLGE